MNGEQHIHIIKNKKKVGVRLIVPTFSLGQLTLSLYVLPVQAGGEKQPSEGVTHHIPPQARSIVLRVPHRTRLD